jgi:hypothetical protein
MRMLQPYMCFFPTIKPNNFLCDKYSFFKKRLTYRTNKKINKTINRDEIQLFTTEQNECFCFLLLILQKLFFRQLQVYLKNKKSCAFTYTIIITAIYIPKKILYIHTSFPTHITMHFHCSLKPGKNIYVYKGLA